MPLSRWAIGSNQAGSRTSAFSLLQALHPRQPSLSRVTSRPLHTLRAEMSESDSAGRRPIWMKFRERQIRRGRPSHRRAQEQQDGAADGPGKPQRTHGRAGVVHGKRRIDLTLNEKCRSLIQQTLTLAESHEVLYAHPNTSEKVDSLLVETTRFRRWREQRLDQTGADKRSLQLQVSLFNLKSHSSRLKTVTISYLAV